MPLARITATVIIEANHNDKKSQPSLSELVGKAAEKATSARRIEALRIMSTRAEGKGLEWALTANKQSLLHRSRTRAECVRYPSQMLAEESEGVSIPIVSGVGRRA